MKKEIKHRCIVSCGICLEEHKRILAELQNRDPTELQNRIDRSIEVLEEVGNTRNALIGILTGESH